MKTYSNKSNAKRAALIAAVKEFNLDAKVIKPDLETYVEFKGNKHAGFTFELLTVVEPDEVVTEPSYVQDETLKPNLENAGYEHLDLPVVDNDVAGLYPTVVNVLKLNAVDIVKEPVNPACKIVGVDLASGPDTTVEATVTVSPNRITKIQKNRETKNNITRPTEGGKCALVWCIADSLLVDTGITPTLKDVKFRAGDLNPNNVSIEFYKWRKFNGITGRIVAKKAE